MLYVRNIQTANRECLEKKISNVTEYRDIHKSRAILHHQQTWKNGCPSIHNGLKVNTKCRNKQNQEGEECLKQKL